MQELLKSLEKNIIQHVEQFIKRVTNQYPSTDTDTLLSLWKNESTTLVTTPTKSTSKISNEGTCSYISIKGKNAGKICGIKPKDGGLYCRTHKKYEGKQPREKKIIPEPKKSSSSSPKQELAQKLFRKYKGQSHLYHPPTNLVIKSPTDRYIIGKIVNEKLEDLTDEDIELCKQWGFPLSSKNFTEEPKKIDEKLTKSEDKKLLDSSKLTESEEDKKLTKKVIDSSDEEEEEKKPTKKVIKSEKKPTKKVIEPEKKPKKVIDSSDEEEKKPTKKVIDSSEEEKKPTKKVIKSEKKPPKKVVDSSDEEEEPRKQNKSKDTEDYINDLADDTSNVVKALGLEEEDE